MTSRLEEFFGDILALAVGAGLTGWGLYHGFLNMRLETQGLVARGHVVQAVPQECDSMMAIALGIEDDPASCYLPAVEFTDRGGQKISFRNDFTERGKDYAQGRDVDVMYLPGDPAGTALLRDRVAIWFDIAATLLMGPLSLLIGAMGVVNARRRRRYRREGDPLRPILRREQGMKYRLSDYPDEQMTWGKLFRMVLLLAVMIGLVALLAKHQKLGPYAPKPPAATAGNARK